MLLPLAVLLTCIAVCGAERPHRLVAVGDLHGDIENAKEILRLAQVIDDQGHWMSGRDTVIQLGDVVDRGPHGHAIMDMLETLEREAAAAGGELIQLLGNHELLNFQGDAKFVAPEHLSAFGGLSAWKREWSSASGKYGSRILRRPVVAIRNHSVFVHAGITADVARLGPVNALNGEVQRLMKQRQFSHPLLLDGGPVWTREIIYSAQQGRCEPLYAALQEIRRQERLSAGGSGGREIRRMVVGHTIQPNGAMRSFCNDSLFAIDVCISQYMQTGGHLAHLELRPTAAGEEVWFFYPPIPDFKHVLHRPERFSVPAIAQSPEQKPTIQALPVREARPTTWKIHWAVPVTIILVVLAVYWQPSIRKILLRHRTHERLV
jgi:hypothetical protein